jgi:alanyl-tRNA synthetase
MDSRMISLEELSKILATARISSSQEERILTAVQNLCTSPKKKEETNEDIKASLMEEEIKKFGEQASELEIEEEKMSCDLHEEDNKEVYNSIETWFHITNRSYYSSFLLFLFISYHSNQLFFHDLVCVNVYFSNPRMNAFLHLFHTWLHWKYSYT